MDIEKIKSELQMKDFHFVECSVKRKQNIANEELNIQVERKINKISDTEHIVTAILNIDKEQKDLEVKVVAEATFIMESDNEELVSDIIKVNTLAIMFPFIRSQVSLLTTQPGMTPVVLPPINTTKFID